MIRSTHFVVAFAVTCVLATTCTSSLGQDAGQPAIEAAKLIDVLQSNAGEFEKAMACRRLSIIGGKEAAPALAPLLADEKLATYARSTLEHIPDAAADEVLREALGKTEGQLRLGVLASIGKRRDAKAAALLAKLAAQRDPALAAAAARALGAIANAEAAGLLGKLLAEAGPESRPAVAVGCLIRAERLQEEGNRESALSLYDAVRRAELPKHEVLAATRRAIVVRGAEGVALLNEELASPDDARFRMALATARDLGVKAAAPLVGRYGKETPARQELLIIALADLGDRAALPTIVDAARQGGKEVRLQALEALGQLADPAGVPTLLSAAVEPDDTIAAAARASLALLKGEQIDAAIAGLLDGDNPRTLQAAVVLAGQRGIASAAPRLFKLVAHADAAVHLAAVKSLGATVSLDDLPKLIALAVAAKAADDAAATQEALKAACVRLPRDACVEKLAAPMAGASSPTKVRLLEQIAVVGGPQALKEVVAAARSADDALQDAATRLLGGWMNVDAAPELLDLAKTLSNPKYRLRSLRGYVRIARQLNMPPEDRLAVCKNALALADRDEEKLLAVETLGRVGSTAALTLAASLLADKSLQGTACSAVVAMSEGTMLTAPEETEKALVQVAALSIDPALRQKVERQIGRARQFVAQRREEGEFVPLFDGRTLSGWEGDPAVFRVEDGALVGGSLKKAVGRGNDFLCTKATYGNFEMRLQFKAAGESPNGGVNLRSKRNPDDGVASGYQADLGDGYWGCLYDEARRNRVLAAARPQPSVRTDDWNDYRVRCEGKRIALWVNGLQTVDYLEQDASISLTGILALQVQANRPSEVWYRNLRIKVLPDTPSK